MTAARVIPLKSELPSPRSELPANLLAMPAPSVPWLNPDPGQGLHDAFLRPLHDLRISVTDRCNFRCAYCMPREVYGPGYRFLPQPDLLSFDEIERTSRLMVSLGVRKLRLTGGEPLLRKQLPTLIAQLARLQTPDGQPVELTLTTNATLLAAQAQSLKDAGLHRVTISLDALDDAIFQRMNDAGVSVARVMQGIEAAQKVGLGPLKVNMVVQKGVNDSEIVPMARHFRHTGIELRFIEYMDVGASNGWLRHQVLPSEQVRQRLAEHFALVPAHRHSAGETAERWAHADGAGALGFISSVTKAFCGDCNRLRLSTDGRLYSCLFATQGHDLRTALRSGEDDATVRARIAALWSVRDDRYSALRSLEALDNTPGADSTSPPRARVEMSYIGG